MAAKTGAQTPDKVFVRPTPDAAKRTQGEREKHEPALHLFSR